MRNVLGTNTCIDIPVHVYRLRHLPLESMLYRLQQVGWLVWLVVLGIYVALAVFQSYRDSEAGDIVLNLKQNSMARRHALFLGRHALFDSAMPFCLAPCRQNVPLIKSFTC